MLKKYKKTLITIVVALVVVGVSGAIILKNRTSLTPTDVTDNFFQEWIAIANRTKASPINQQLHKKSTYVTPAFAHVVARQASTTTALDPVVCSESMPVSVTVVSSTIQKIEHEERAHTVVDATYATGIKRIDVVLINENGFWRIDEIDCPAV